MAYEKRAPRCYESHPPLKIGEYKIFGGSCAYPVVKDADVYVGFDLSMNRGEMDYPWTPGTSFLFYIPDMGVPHDREGFKSLVYWLKDQLVEGKKVHIGCIGGHGRTGMVLSALVKHMTGIEDSTSYVRKHYCHKAVESQAQIEFLYQVFGVKRISPTKENMLDFGHSGKATTVSAKATSARRPYGSRDREEPKGLEDLKTTRPTKNPSSIWGSNVAFDKL